MLVVFSKDIVELEIMPLVFVPALCPWVGVDLLLLQVLADVINPSLTWVSLSALCFRSYCGWVPEGCFLSPSAMVHVYNVVDESPLLFSY